ncbi:MAG: excinuclease ABC subunit UvrC [Candidatus Firestonebacteria bacterium]
MSLTEKIKNLPEKSGVYLMKDADARVIYVGKSANLKDRVRSYFLEKSRYDRKVAALVPKIFDIEIITTKNEIEALLLESKLIKKYRPKYNVLFKDDKTYPYIRLSVNEEFPRISLTRRVLPDSGRYFGPYVFGSVGEIIKVIQKSYKLRNCRLPLPFPAGKKTERACLKEELNFCTAPCLEKVTREEYAAQVKGVIGFLSGKQKELEQKLELKMKKASENMDYEQAALLRDQRELALLIAAQNAGKIEMSGEVKEDAQDAQIERALADLKLLLALKTLPLTIEGVDISNISGLHAVGSVVRFFNGLPDKDGYRKFKIKTLSSPDDTGMLREVVEIKYRRALAEKKLPDLVLIDGGKGQLNAAKEVLAALGVELPVISLAKREEEIYFSATASPLRLKKDPAALHLLQYVRDEAHRFAVNYHRTLRNKGTVSSKLDGLPGVGPKTKRKLLAGVKDINRPAAEELSALSGISKKIKERLKGAP